MNTLAALLTIVVLGAVVLLISAPLRRSGRASGAQPTDRAALEAAREAKYREIRDCELDYHTGKLSDEDFAAVDRGLRAEAMGLLRRIEELEPCSLGFVVMETIFSLVQVVVAVVLIFLVLMHSGKDSGLSGAFGVGSGSGPLGGGSMVERNLNRWTVFFAVVFVLNTVLLLKKPWA